MLIIISRISPERLFLRSVLDDSDVTSADHLAVILNLDLNSLYHHAAEVQLVHGRVKLADKYLHKAKVNI